MNYHAMMKEYKNVDTKSKIESANNHDFIKYVLQDLLNNLQTLSYCIKNEPVMSEAKSKSFSQSLIAIMLLQTSLDFENGEPIASNLFNLYDYCKKSILTNYRTRETEDINKSIIAINEILDAWKQIS